MFVHIRKTAGKTLRQILYRQYKRGRTRLVRNYFVAPDLSRRAVQELAASPPPDLRVAHGHILFWSDVDWPQGTRFLTMLRDPVERAISHYYWLLTRNPRLRKTLEEAVADGLIVDNLQTRVLSADMPPFGKTTEESLGRAVQNLGQFDVVGLTERFDESLVLMTRAFGWRRMLYRKTNVTPDREPRERISPRALELIEHHNALDTELYRIARERFDQELTSQGEAFHIEVAALKRANALVADAADGEPLADVLPSTIDDAGRGPSGRLDLRALLIEAQADLLRRDAEMERLAARPDRRPPVRSVPAAPDPEPSALERRQAALEHAADRARRRIANLKQQIDALEQAGATGDDEEKLAELRRHAERAAARLSGFERRAARVRERVDQDARSDTEATESAEPTTRRPARKEGPGEPKKAAAKPKKAQTAKSKASRGRKPGAKPAEHRGGAAS